MNESLFRFTPAVMAAGNEYSIYVFTASEKCVMSVTVDGKVFTDNISGIMRTECESHRVSVPMELLNGAGSYTVTLTEVVIRNSYSSQLGKSETRTFSFTPIPEDDIKIFWLSDSHGCIAHPTDAYKNVDKCDLLVMGGDYDEHNKDLKARKNLFGLIEKITGGEKPVVVLRGNHDCRGECAETVSDYMPTPGGKTYYTFRLGSLWGLVLDCGEDKNDSSVEYGGMASYVTFRREEGEFIDALSEAEYNAEGIKYKVAFCHIPFTRKFNDIFDIENDTYDRWVKSLNKLGLNIMVCGHEHIISVDLPGCENDARGMTFPTVLASGLDDRDDDFVYSSTELTLKNGQVSLTFCDSDGGSSDFKGNPL